MSQPPVPTIECRQQHPSMAVGDVRAAAEYYVSRLGFTLGFNWGEPPSMAGVNLGEVQMFLQNGSPCVAGCSVYFRIEDADELFAFQRANGVEVVEPVADRPWGVRDYTVRDLDGYRLVFGHPIYSVGPSVPIERVDVPLRLERRLAALLYDLAEHKHMSLTSCVEETLLHTFESVGEGVASPHTRRTLEYIQQLKARHGIDYDGHAPYRFVEQ
jgi:catechol 2,3-dioxygenase-like lactoylglutathione lyase family enzyme